MIQVNGLPPVNGLVNLLFLHVSHQFHHRFLLPGYLEMNQCSTGKPDSFLCFIFKLFDFRCIGNMSGYHYKLFISKIVKLNQ